MKTTKTKQGEVMWPRLVANKYLGRKSSCEIFNTGTESENETDDEGTTTTPPLTKENSGDYKPSPLSRGSPPSPNHSTGKPPKCPSPNDLSPSSSVSSSSREHSLVRMNSETLWTDCLDTRDYKLFVGTWNVAGRTPPEDLDLQQWLMPEENSPDIYVIGFQEIVPLKAGNVFGSESMNGSPANWDTLIRNTLNGVAPWTVKKTERPNSFGSKGSETPKSTSLGRSSSAPSSLFVSLLSPGKHSHEKNKKDDIVLLRKKAKAIVKPVDLELDADKESVVETDPQKPKIRQRYRRIASKQMVGLFITIWVKPEIRRHIRALRVSCVGCGIMGCLGNKGSISVSLSIHETNFCFVCTHLASGQKEGDETRRNADVVEILKRTIFNCSPNVYLPTSILAHDRIIWFGDLNYRLTLPDSEVRSLVEKRDWIELLRSDQLRQELTTGRAFKGWHEGVIEFPPTYKYIPNTDRYSGIDAKPGEKRRAPAWCDRVLWHGKGGKGVKQLKYMRAELTLSDHRPVAALFVAQVEALNERKVKQNLGFTAEAVVSPGDMTNLISLEIDKLSRDRFSSELLGELATIESNVDLKPEKPLAWSEMHMKSDAFQESIVENPTELRHDVAVMNKEACVQ